MFFTILVFIAALALEGLGSYLSVLGLASHGSVIMICFAIILDFSKVMIATVLYKKWTSLHIPLKAFFIPVLLFLMVITSSGTYAFLVREFSKTTLGQEQVTTQIELLKEEKTKLEARKKEIDGQISQLPASSVLQRKRMTDLFDKELTKINERVDQLDKDIPQMTLTAMGTSTESGTLGSIAKSYNTSPEQVAKILAFFMTLVVDPSAIGLLVIANFLMEQNKKEKKDRLMQQLKGELPDDEDSLLQRLRNKVSFLKHKNGQSNFFTHIFFNDPKTEIVHKAFMKSIQIDIPNHTFITSIQMLETPKVYVPTKYSSVLSNVIHSIFFKESRPEIVKVPPQKINSNLKNIDFITEIETVEPLVVVNPFNLLAKNELSLTQFAIHEGEFKVEYIPPTKLMGEIGSDNVIESINEVNMVRVKHLLKLEQTELAQDEFMLPAIYQEVLMKENSDIANNEFIQNIEMKDAVVAKVLVKTHEHHIEVLPLFQKLEKKLIKTQSYIIPEDLISNIELDIEEPVVIIDDNQEELDALTHSKPFIKMAEEDDILWREKKPYSGSLNIDDIYSKEDDWDYQPDVLEGYTEEELDQLELLEQQASEIIINDLLKVEEKNPVEEDNHDGFNVKHLLEESFA